MCFDIVAEGHRDREHRLPTSGTWLSELLSVVNPGLLCAHADFERLLNNPHRLEHLKCPRLDVKSARGLYGLVEPVDKAALDAAPEEFACQGQTRWPGTNN